MKHGAIFDMDGLLLDTERLYQKAWVDTAADFDREPSHALAQAVCGTSGEYLKEIVRSYYPGVDAEAYIQAVLDRVSRQIITSGAELMPGAREILTYLAARGVKLAVASGSPGEIIEQNLSRNNLKSFFPVAVSGFDVPNGKPAPDIFLVAAGKLGVPPEECYVFEDGINGALAGIAAGCTTVMIPDLMKPTPELVQNCAGIYKSLTDALDAIKAGVL